MDEDESSMVSNAKLNVAAGAPETSDCGNNNYPLRASKRSRHEANAPLARFKGVVPQQNGHWGAQIYANHHRIWLGTFKSEKQAAMAYDSAAIKLRSGDSHRNFPRADHNIQEPDFQNLYGTEDVLNMIRDGSYQAKFAEFVNTLSKRDGILGKNVNKNWVHGDMQYSCMQLFQKELTPSDVGKLNRLVIPKKYAVKYFPYICENDPENLVGGGLEEIELVFYDRLMRTWKFRYCYWRSSQSFVFTRGWNRFVKENKLKERDIITFYTCKCPAGSGEKDGQNFFLIDVKSSGEQSCTNGEKVLNRVESSPQDLQVELELNLGNSFYCRIDNGNSQLNEDKALSGFKLSHNVEEKRVTLFGVQIN